MGGETVTARPGTFARIDREWSGTTEVTVRLPMRFRVESAGFDSVSLHRGPLLYGVNIPETWTKLRGEEPAADWQVLPRGVWNLVPNLPEDFTALDKALSRRDRSGDEQVPFAPEMAPLRVEWPATRLEQWGGGVQRRRRFAARSRRTRRTKSLKRWSACSASGPVIPRRGLIPFPLG